MFERPTTPEITPEVEPIALDPHLQEVRDSALRYHRDNEYTGDPLLFWDWLDQLSPDNRLSYLLGDHANRAYDEDNSSRRSFSLGFEFTKALGESLREEQTISYDDATLLILHQAATKRREDISGEGARTCLYETLMEMGHIRNESMSQIVDAILSPKSKAPDAVLSPYADYISNFRDIWRRDVKLFNKEQRVLYVSRIVGSLATDFEMLGVLTGPIKETSEDIFENSTRSFEALREELNSHRAILEDVSWRAKADREARPRPRVSQFYSGSPIVGPRPLTPEEKHNQLIDFYKKNPDLQTRALMAKQGMLRTLDEMGHTVTPENIDDAFASLLVTRPELRPELPDAIAALRGHVALMREFKGAPNLSQLILRAKDNVVAFKPSEQRFRTLHQILSSRGSSLQSLATDVRKGIEELLLGPRYTEIESYLPRALDDRKQQSSESLGNAYRRTANKLLALLLTKAEV